MTMNPTSIDMINNITAIKARQKATWESGDFGQIARHTMPSAREFMARLPLQPHTRLLDVACGNGNLATLASERGCRDVHGVDIAANLIQQARTRAASRNLPIQFREGDAEALPYADREFDAVVTMYGAMFTPRPDLAAAELFRVTKPGGFVAMANWTPEGFIGKMFTVLKRHLPPPPAEIPSPMLWGDEPTVRQRLGAFAEVRLARRMAVFNYPFPPADVVEFFRRFYGPTGRAFESLDPHRQEALRQDLVELQAAHNTSGWAETTEARAEYLEVIAIRGHDS